MIRTLFGLAFGWLAAGVAMVVSRLRLGHTPETRRVTRRSFLRNAALGSVAVVLAQLGAGFVRLLWPNKTGAFGSALTVSASEVPAVNGTPYRVNPGKFYLVRTDAGLLALYWKCPHLGCTVPWNEGEQKFHCPCHGSIYEYNGRRIAGPAPRPLDLMAVTVTGSGDVVVDTGDISTRSDYKPEQAVPYPA